MQTNLRDEILAWMIVALFVALGWPLLAIPPTIRGSMVIGAFLSGIWVIGLLIVIGITIWPPA